MTYSESVEPLQPQSPKRLMFTGLLLALACSTDVSDDVGREVERVRGALVPSDHRDLETQGPSNGVFSVSWEWRFVTAQPAASYRASLMRSLDSTFRCQEERRRVTCSRTLPGDRLVFDVRANPFHGDTLVKARLTMSAD